MKILKIGGFLLLAAATVFFGIAFFFGEDTPPVNDVPEQEANVYLEELAFYRDLSAQLGDEVTRLKQAQYEAAVQYEEKIAALENLVEAGKEESQPVAQSVFTYEVTERGIAITGYQGSDATVAIPSYIDGYKVVSIGQNAFRELSLVEVVIPATVTYVDWFAFFGSGLKRIAIPASVTMIEYGAFDGCTGLTVYCEKDSYADRYARSFGFAVVN
jgi:hypothetical protein